MCTFDNVQNYKKKIGKKMSNQYLVVIIITATLSKPDLVGTTKQLDVKPAMHDDSSFTFKQFNETLKCVKCNISVLKADILNSLNSENNTVTILDLRKSAIEYIENNTFVKFAYCRELKLGFNFLKYIPLNIFTNVSNLTKLDLSYNNISIIKNDNFIYLNNLKELNLEYNCIAKLEPNSFFGLGKLSKLNLQSNNISLLGTILNSLTSIQVINLENNELEFLDGNEFSTLFFLSDLNLSKNKIQHLLFNLDLHSFNNVRNLQLNHNFINYINQKTFKNFIYLENLDLSFNNITKISPKSFSSCVYLKNVNISFNSLKTLNSNMLQTTSTINLVNASNNLIQKINFTNIFSSVTLKKLDLSNNRICSFEFSIFTQFDFINLQNNYLSCSKEQEIKNFYFLSNENFIITDNCDDKSKENNPDNICTHKDTSASNIIQIVLIVVLSSIVVSISLYFAFIKKITFWRTTDLSNEDSFIGQNSLLTVVDEFLYAINTGINATTSSLDRDAADDAGKDRDS